MACDSWRAVLERTLTVFYVEVMIDLTHIWLFQIFTLWLWVLILDSSNPRSLS